MQRQVVYNTDLLSDLVMFISSEHIKEQVILSEKNNTG